MAATRSKPRNTASKVVAQCSEAPQSLRLQSKRKKHARSAEDHEDGPPKKRAKQVEIPPAKLPPTPASQVALLLEEAEKNLHNQKAADGAHRRPFTEEKALLEDPMFHLHDSQFSDTDSEMTEVTQPSYATPKSSRANTPLPSEVYHVDRAVKIMQTISKEDQEILAEITKLRETAASLRKRTQDIRDVVCSERARRERMEVYFTYWTNVDGTWPRDWLYGEAMVPAKYLRPNGGDDIIGPPTLPRGKAVEQQRPADHQSPALHVPESAGEQSDGNVLEPC
ncbi:hypothetical protein ID866_691 [Astraeus odoratus]|nr:hypothetical protein ID866_691 [Astraeus odoratus]